MLQHNKSCSFPLRPEACGEQRGERSGERGYAFLILMMVLTILLISLTVALPDVYTKGQREREEELIFRGNEYARAIMQFHRQFNRYPASVKELEKRTNGFRFLRHAYRDPMSRSGKWRFIHANAAGAVFDSKTMAPPGPQSGEKKDEAKAAKPREKPQEEASASGEIKGAFIVGVASSSTHKSIRVWNNHDRYDEWEFLGVQTAAAGAAGASPASGAQPGAPGAGAQQGMPTPSPQPGMTRPMTQPQ